MRFVVVAVCLFVLVCSGRTFAQDSSNDEAPSASEVLLAIKASMKKYDGQFFFEGSSLETRVLPDSPDADPIMGRAQWSIACDGTRWKCDEKNFVTRRTKTGVTKKDVVEVAGYDGKDYWHVDGGTLYIGEKQHAIHKFAPTEVFWNVGGSPSWLLSILSKHQPEITSIEMDDQPCWRIVSTVRDRHYDIIVSPTHAWLPLSTTIKIGDKIHTRETLSSLKTTSDGIWYPSLIELKRPGAIFGARQSRIRVTEFTTSPSASDFGFEIAVDQQVVDYGRGLVWENDPWWPDLDQFLHEQVGFPRKNPACFHSLRTAAMNRERDGKAAPELRVRKWLNLGGNVTKPVQWAERPEGTTTVLYFFSGSAFSPSSRKIHGLRSLKRHYPDAPVQLIGITAADASEEEVRRTIETLHIDFPVAIDKENEPNIPNSSGYGQCHTAFGVHAGVVLVDPAQKVQFIHSDSIKAFTNLGRFGTTNPPEPVKPLPDYRTSREESDRIKQRWLQLVKDAPANGTISGKVVFVQGAATDRFEDDPGGEDIGTLVEIRLTPELHVNTYNGWGAVESFVDRNRVQQLQTDITGEFEFTGLSKGRYELVIAPAFGLAKTTKEFIVPSGESNVEVGEIRLQQSSEIIGVVVDESGTPIPNATVKAVARHFDPTNLDMETNANLPASQTTDADGKFHFQGLHVGAFSFVVKASGYSEARQAPVAAGKQDVSFQLKRTKTE